MADVRKELDFCLIRGPGLEHGMKQRSLVIPQMAQNKETQKADGDDSGSESRKYYRMNILAGKIDIPLQMAEALSTD